MVNINIWEDCLNKTLRRKKALEGAFNDCEDPKEIDCVILELKAVEAWERLYRNRIRET